MGWTIGFLAAYVVAMIGIGIWCIRHTRTLNDFFLGGRDIGPWMSAFSYGTSYFSAVLFIGFAGTLGWKFGAGALWIAAGNALFGALAAWFVLARRTRRMTHRLDAMTMPEFFAARFDLPSLKTVAALIIFIFLIPYSASVYKGLGYLFESHLHIPFDVALLLMTALTGLYLVLGGYMAVTVTDLVQGVIMLGGSLALVWVIGREAGGLGESLARVREVYPAHVPKSAPWFVLPSLVLMTSFGTWGLPQMVQKFYAVRNEQVIPRAAWVTFVFAIIVSFAAYFTGANTHLFYETLPAGGPEVFDKLVPDMLSTLLPAPLMGLILLLILSASMSTLSSLVLVSSSALTIDLIEAHRSPGASQRKSVMIMRLFSLLFVVLSFVMARWRVQVIVTLMSVSWGAVAGAFLAPYLYGLFWRRTTGWGALAGMLTGIGLALGLFFRWGAPLAPVASVLAMLAPFAVVPAVSLLTPPVAPATLERAFGAEA